MNLKQLHAKGFDTSVRYADDAGDLVIRVPCGQCAAIVINGTPCHEQGCPNAARAKRNQEIEDQEEGG